MNCIHSNHAVVYLIQFSMLFWKHLA